MPHPKGRAIAQVQADVDSARAKLRTAGLLIKHLQDTLQTETLSRAVAEARLQQAAACAPSVLAAEFYEKYGLTKNMTPTLPDKADRDGHLNLIAEEMTELLVADGNDDLIGIADALADITYTVYGTALAYGIDLDGVMAEVHRSNMTKTAGEDGYKRVVKGKGYEAPDLAPILGLADNTDAINDALATWGEAA